MTQRRYRLDIYARGVTSTTGSISYTFDTSQFAEAPIVRTQIVRASEGTVESQPWTARLMDSNQSFTALLADSSGRMQLLGRLVRLRSSLDSTASSNYQNLAVARFTDLQMSGDVATYDCTFTDERWIERQTQVFTKANTCMLIPVGLINAFHTAPATPPVNWRVEKVTGNVVLISYYGNTQQSPNVFTTYDALQVIIGDVKPGAIGGSITVTAGNFNTVRFRDATNTTDREIVTFDSTHQLPSVRPVLPAPTIVDNMSKTLGMVETPFYAWLYWPTSQPSVGATIKGYIYAPTHTPTDSFPLHIGGTDGKRPFTLVKELYQGTYSGTTSLTVRYSTSAITALENDPSYGVGWWRITSPAQLDQFLDDHIYGPYSAVPFTDSSGKIAPLSLRLPHSTAITPATLPTLGSSNIVAGTHPTWEHPSDEVVNAIRINVPTYTNLAATLPGPITTIVMPGFQGWPGAGIDHIQVSTGFLDRTHDSINNIGRRERQYTLAGAVSKSPVGTPPTTGTCLPSADDLADQLASNIFPRFGDGPIYSSINAMQTVDTSTAYGRLLQGKFVKVSLATFPNPVVNARGSTRLMQIIERQDRPDGPSFRLLDVGPNLAALSGIAISLAQSTRSPRHAVVGTISSIPAGAGWDAQLAITSTGTTAAPVTTSTKWFPVAGKGQLSVSTSFTRGQLPSKSKIWGRVRALKSNRIGSNWSAAASVVTASITAPSGFAVSSITAGTATFKWTNGSTEYPSQVMVDATSTATLGTTNVAATVTMGTTRFDATGLTANDGHKAGVRHFDLYGGVSASNSATFTTTTGFTKLGKPKLSLLWGA